MFIALNNDKMIVISIVNKHNYVYFGITTLLFDITMITRYLVNI